MQKLRMTDDYRRTHKFFGTCVIDFDERPVRLVSCYDQSFFRVFFFFASKHATRSIASRQSANPTRKVSRTGTQRHGHPPTARTDAWRRLRLPARADRCRANQPASLPSDAKSMCVFSKPARGKLVPPLRARMRSRNFRPAPIRAHQNVIAPPNTTALDPRCASH